MFFKSIIVPADNSTKQIEAVQLWEVRWRSRHRDGYIDMAGRPEVETFVSEDLAKEFARSLVAAFALVRNTDSDSNKVKLTKAA